MKPILILCLAALSTAAGGDLRWMIATSAIRKLETADPSGGWARRFFLGSGNFVMNGNRGTEGFPAGAKAVPAATYPSYAAMAQALRDGKLPPDVKAVIYDNESWKFTPSEEQHEIERFEKLAADAIHASGRILIATPAADLVPVLNPRVERGRRYDEYVRLGIARMAARYADVYEIQAQGSEDSLELYTRFVKSAAAQARAANPNVQIFAGLSTNPSGKHVTAEQLQAAVRATRDAVDGYWLNIPSGGAYCPRCGEARPRVAIDLLQSLERSSNGI